MNPPLDGRDGMVPPHQGTNPRGGATMPDSPEEPSMAEFAKRLENAVRKNAGRPADGQRKEDKPPPDPRVPSTYPGMEEALSRMRPAEAVLNNPEDRTELGITYWAPPEKSAPPPS